MVIAHLEGPPPHGEWTHLFDDHRAVMCQPSHPFLAQDSFELSDILAEDLLHVVFRRNEHSGEFTWQEWAAAKGLGGPPISIAAQVTAEHLAVEMIQHRLSFALVTTKTVADYVGDGRLAVVAGSVVGTNYSYWGAVVAQDPSPNRLANQFIQWVLASLADTNVAAR